MLQLYSKTQQNLSKQTILTLQLLSCTIEPVLIDHNYDVTTLFKPTAERVQTDHSDVTTVLSDSRSDPVLTNHSDAATLFHKQ